MIQFRVLGEIATLVDGERVALGGARQRRLLAMLLVHRNTVVSVDRLADAVFAGEPTDAAATTLRSYIARIRRAIDGHDERVRVITQPPGYCLEVPDELVDAAVVEALVLDAGRSLLRGDPQTAGSAARQAIERWSGDPYAEFADEPWVQPEAQRLDEIRLVAADRHFDAELACGRSKDTVSAIERMVHDHPLREGFRTQLMLALYRAGRQADALRAYQGYRTFLADELGLEPSPAVAALEARILAHDPSLAADSGRSVHGYRLGERLGSGRGGALFAARIPGIEHDFVLRSFRSDVADEPHFVQTFESDAHRLASLRHPAIVPLHDYWRGPHEAYLSTIRLRGGTLDDRLRAGPLEHHELVSLVERVGGALVAAEAAGITHGHLTAGNVLFDDGGSMFVTDFGLGSCSRAAAVADVAAFAALVGSCSSWEPLHRHLAGVHGDATASMGDLVAGLLALFDASPATATNPYKGLEAFDEVDAAHFFGREALVDDIVKRLHEDDVRGRFVLVVGGSGSGKSSLVRAGLLPRLRAGAVPGSDGWLITTCTPGTSPLQRLGEALTRLSVDAAIAPDELDRPGAIGAAVRRVAGETEVVVVVDQLEELFTSADPAAQRHFLDGLAEALGEPDPRLRVVATLRADFFDRPLAFASIGRLVGDAAVLIPAMTPAELDAAITEPARRVGRSVEGPLAAELVSAVVNDAAALPALQFTLYELAARCDSTLTLAASRELGGLSGAVAARADALYRGASVDEQTLIRRLFERMIVLSDGEAMRRRVPITDLASGPDASTIDSVIERWVAARLLTRDRDPRSRTPTVEVAHEALVRRWPRLQRWIADDREALATVARVHDAALAWSASDREPDALARGLLLEAAIEVADERPADLSPAEHEFVATSREASEAAAAEQATRLARERRTNRHLRWQLVALGCLLVAALGIGLVAVDQRRDADRSRRSAVARELAAAAQANLAVDPERSMLLALAAVDLSRSNGQAVLPDVVSALHASVVGSRIERRIEGLGGTVDWSPTGEYLVSEGPEGSGIVDLRDPATGASVRRWTADAVDINDVAFSADGSLLATTGDDGALRVWDPHTGELRFEHRVDDGGGVWGPSFSGDGRRLAASWIDEGMVRVFDVTSGQLVNEGEAEQVVSTSLDGDGSHVVVGAGDGHAYVVDVVTAEVQATFEAPDGVWLRIVRFSPDGQLIAASGTDGIVRVWDVHTSERVHAIGELGAAQLALAWSRDGSKLAVGAEDGAAQVFELDGAEVRRVVTLSAQDTRNGVQGLAFSPDGTHLATGDLGIASIIVWDIGRVAPAEWANAIDLAEPFVPLGVTGAGEVIAAAADGSVTAYSTVTGAARRIVDRSGDTDLRVAVDRAGTVIATAPLDFGAPVRIWDAASGREIASFVPVDFDDYVTGLAWSPDGSRLAVAGGDGDSSSVVVVDRAGTVAARFVEEPGVYLRSSSFSPDGRLLAIPRRPLRQGLPEQQGIWIWDWAASRMIGKLDTQSLAADWDPGGERLVTVAELEATGEVWDVATLTRIRSFQGTSTFTDVRFSPDGAMVATSSLGGDATLWDAGDGTLVATLRGSPTSMVSLVFTGDGRRLVTVDDDGVLRVWAIDLDDLVGIAEQRLTRHLTDLECRQFLHRDTC